MTAIILYRVAQIQNASARLLAGKTEKLGGAQGSGQLRWSQLSQILVESAVVYTLAGIILLIVNFVGSNAVYPMSDLVSVVCQIAFMRTRIDSLRADRRCRLQGYSMT